MPFLFGAGVLDVATRPLASSLLSHSLNHPLHRIAGIRIVDATAVVHPGQNSTPGVAVRNQVPNMSHLIEGEAVLDEEEEEYDEETGEVRKVSGAGENHFHDSSEEDDDVDEDEEAAREVSASHYPLSVNALTGCIGPGRFYCRRR